jgi:TENA/THI-4/PQQC family
MKSPKLADMREAAAGISAIIDIEMNLHVKVCAGWGLSPTDLEQTPPAVEMLAYTRCVLDTGMRGDLLALNVALAPLRDQLRRDRDAARLTARCARCNKPVSRLDRRVCWGTIPGGRGESAGAPGRSRRSLRHAGPRGRARDLQGSHPARSPLLGNGLACG